ncbi:hypothetical protein MTsPCn3_22310 [Erythrobacter sp. MTPC3]
MMFDYIKLKCENIEIVCIFCNIGGGIQVAVVSRQSDLNG